LDRAAAELKSWVERTPAGQGAVRALSGPPTAGKSSVLANLRSELERQYHVLSLTAPPQSEDAGPMLLVQAAAALGDGVLLEALRDPSLGWTDKLERVRKAIHDRQEDILILFDEPMLQAPQHRGDFENRNVEVSTLLVARTACRRIISTAETSLIQTLTEEPPVPLPARSPASFLDPGNWNGLSGAAQDVSASLGAAVSSYTPLELRLLIGIMKLGGIQALHLARQRDSRRHLAQVLASLVREESLRRIWSVLALERRPFGDDLLEHLGLGTLDADVQTVVRSCLLFEVGGQWVLHDILRQDPEEGRWLSRDERDAIHRSLAAYHEARFQSSVARGGVSASLQHEMEIFHHWSAAGEVEMALQRAPWFVEQLYALAREVSRRKPWDDAVALFERSLQRSSDDGYAHHYLAYNLDVQGKRPDRVERHYRRATEVQPAQVWWHGRWITFLITLGRQRDARKAWDEALDTLKPLSHGHEVYIELHRYLRRGETEDLISRIWSQWHSRPASRWELLRGRTLEVGDRTRTSRSWRPRRRRGTATGQACLPAGRPVQMRSPRRCTCAGMTFASSSDPIWRDIPSKSAGSRSAVSGRPCTATTRSRSPTTLRQAPCARGCSSVRRTCLTRGSGSRRRRAQAPGCRV